MADAAQYRTVGVEIALPPLHPAAAVDPARTAILVVDLQNQWIHPRSEDYSSPEGMEAVHATAALLEGARSQGAKVLWAVSLRRPEQAMFTVYGMKPYRLEGTWSVELVEPLEPAPGEPVFPKYTHDLFLDTDFEAYLEGNGIVAPDWAFVVVGVSLGGCVFHGATGLSMREFRVLVPMDCVAPRTGPTATVAQHWLGKRGYAHNIALLESWKGIRFDASVPTDPRCLPVAPEALRSAP